MSDLAATYVPEIDAIRVDIPGQGHRYTTLLTPAQALALATSLKVAIAYREPPRPAPTTRTRKAAK
jgi:hypothetical protein